jgi:homogentisate 1,2-dioxygenase
MYEFPKRLMRPSSFWVDGYPFSQAAPVPAEPVEIDDPANREGEWDVYLKYHKPDEPVLRLVYPFSPFDAFAWEGDIYPFVLHLKDIRAIASPDMHIEPKVLTTFVTEDESALVQTFKPRWSHSLPYPHQNFVTEVLFNHRGYAARPKIKDGCVTLHPPGTFHGPDLRALKRDNEREVHPSQLPWRDEVAVMLEVRSPLRVMPSAQALEIEGYEESWHEQWVEITSEREAEEKRAKTEERKE